jgi:hypothetical protein
MGEASIGWSRASNMADTKVRWIGSSPAIIKATNVASRIRLRPTMQFTTRHSKSTAFPTCPALSIPTRG